MKHTIIPAAVLGLLMATSGVANAEMHKGPRGQHGDKMFEKIDTNKDGAISKAESQTAHDTRFVAMDTNKDGNVTKEEAKAHWETKRAAFKAKHDAAK